ncbi:hypothetical protein SAMN06309944_1787 [Micrococcales bacterium KH10]|nr:hypothetical protein SAMN06309944_1787 [Micrococcales bacterium KH10]
MHPRIGFMSSIVPGPDPTQPTLVSIGNIHVGGEQVTTPVGTWSTADINISTQDNTQISTYTPGWAIALAVIFVWFFLLSLLFLLVRNPRMSGSVTVTVWASNGQSYSDTLWINNEYEHRDVFNRVQFAQNLIGQSRWRHGAR